MTVIQRAKCFLGKRGEKKDLRGERVENTFYPEDGGSMFREALPTELYDATSCRNKMSPGSPQMLCSLRFQRAVVTVGV